MTQWRVGELAEATGLTVRALHHYDQIGLLPPSERTAGGHRLYADSDVRRLYRIVALRRLGFTLDQVGEWLDRADFDQLDAVRRQRAQLAEQMRAQRRLDYLLERLEETLAAGDEPGTEVLLAVIERTHTLDQYYSPEAMRRLDERRAAVGQTEIRAAEAEWPRLIAEVQRAYDDGLDPADPHVQKLADRWQELVRSFHGDDPEIKRGLRKFWESDGEELAARGLGPSRELLRYVGDALGWNDNSH